MGHPRGFFFVCRNDSLASVVHVKENFDYVIVYSGLESSSKIAVKPCDNTLKGRESFDISFVLSGRELQD